MTILDLAERYVDKGYSVVPIAADGSKRPTVQWERWQKERPDRDALSRLFSFATLPGKPLLPRNVGIAVIHGAISGNSEALDFDDPTAYCEFEEACFDGGFADPLSGMVHVQTPCGGRHVYYRCEEPVEGNLKLAYDETGNKIRIETRGEGGYTIAPGSPAACHPTGRRYGKLPGFPSFVDVPTIGADVRDALLYIARSLCKKPKQEIRASTSAAGPRPYGAVRPGDDYNARASQADVLELLTSAGWTVASQSGRVIHLQRPGKTGKGTSATLGHDGDNVLHIFSTNAPPGFETGPNAAFTVYAQIRHMGDFRAAATDLAKQGYGDTRTPAERRRDAMIRGIK